MYHYYSAVGYHAVFFFIIVTFIAFLMLMRLYIAVFLCYFKAELHKKEKKQSCVENATKHEFKEDSQASKNSTSNINKSELNE